MIFHPADTYLYRAPDEYKCLIKTWLCIGFAPRRRTYASRMFAYKIRVLRFMKDLNTCPFCIFNRSFVNLSASLQEEAVTRSVGTDNWLSPYFFTSKAMSQSFHTGSSPMRFRSLSTSVAVRSSLTWNCSSDCG